ncbi:MAG: hypothetical protein ABTQ25_17545 [Nitrosomonas ureae]
MLLKLKELGIGFMPFSSLGKGEDIGAGTRNPVSTTIIHSNHQVRP